MKKFLKTILVLCIIGGVLYAGYKLLTRDDEFDEFDDDFDLED